MLAHRHGRLAIAAVSSALVFCWLPGVRAHAEKPQAEPLAQEPTPQDLAACRVRIAEARQALGRLRRVSDEDRRELEARVRQAESALARYERLAAQGKPRRRAQGVLYTAGVAVLANDVSGVGVVDDALIPLLLLGLWATRLLAKPVAQPELHAAWRDVVQSMTAVGAAARAASARRPRLPPRNHCREHYVRCTEHRWAIAAPPGRRVRSAHSA